MPSNKVAIQQQTQTQLSELHQALSSGALKPVRRMLNSLPPAKIAHLLESSPPRHRGILWTLIEQEQQGEVLPELNDDIQSQFLELMDTQELIAVTEGLDTDDFADLIQNLPDRVIGELMAAMSSQDRSRVESVLSYPEDTAGGLMDTDTITIRPRLTLDVVLRYLRRHDYLPKSTDSLIVVNRRDQFLGTLPLSILLTSDPNLTVREVMNTEVQAIQADLHDSDVALLFEQNDWISAPVVGENGKLVGRITIDDVVDVIREDADHSLMSMAGLDEEEDTFATVSKTTPRRAIWLGINLITVMMSAAVIGLYEDTIEKVVALAILSPIVPSMGGIAGSQTLTVMIRGMAQGQIGHSNIRWLLSRECWVGLINGMIWALVIGGVAALWFEDFRITLCIGAAMLINLVTAVAAGTLLPVILKRFKIDPALAGGVILTTITDVVGFVSFFGLATWFYA